MITIILVPFNATVSVDVTVILDKYQNVQLVKTELIF